MPEPSSFRSEWVAEEKDSSYSNSCWSNGPSSSTLIGITDILCIELQEEVDSKGGTFPCDLKDNFQHKVPSNPS